MNAEEILAKVLEVDVKSIRLHKSSTLRVSEAIDAMEEYASQSKWVSVSERLPEEDEQVLFLTDSGVIEGCFVNEKHKKWRFIFLDDHGCGCCSSDSDKVTYWQPLPKAPEKI
jgi:hypothetical protein